MPPKVISGGDNPYDIHDAKLSSSATAHESSSVTAHEISNNLVLCQHVIRWTTSTQIFTVLPPVLSPHTITNINYVWKFAC